MTAPEVETELNGVRDAILERNHGLYLQDFPCEVSTLGTWILACCIKRNYDRSGSINLCLLYELIVKFISEDNPVVFNDLLTDGEALLCGDGCNSCLRAILRQADRTRQCKMAYPFSCWEH